MTDEQITEFFKVRLAGKNIEIECIYRDVFHYCRNYLAKFDVPDMVIAATADDIAFEQEKSDRESISEGREPTVHSEGYLEILAVYRKIATTMLDYGIFMMHGATVAVGDQSYIFTAPSGIGKTTHIKNWLKVVPGAYVVNGDKPLIDTVNMAVCGTPWSGKESMNTNTCVPLAGIVFLERGPENIIEKISFHEALPGLISQSYRPDGTKELQKTLDLIGRLQKIPCYHMFCNMDPESAMVSYNALRKRNKDET